MRLLTGRPVAEVTGRGAGIDDAGLERKARVVEKALALNRPDPSQPLDVLRKVGGLEIAGLAGLFEFRLGGVGQIVARLKRQLERFVIGSGERSHRDHGAM